MVKKGVDTGNAGIRSSHWPRQGCGRGPVRYRIWSCFNIPHYRAKQSR